MIPCVCVYVYVLNNDEILFQFGKVHFKENVCTKRCWCSSGNVCDYYKLNINSCSDCIN